VRRADLIARSERFGMDGQTAQCEQSEDRGFHAEMGTFLSSFAAIVCDVDRSK
jgi:hypothetical protein